MTTNLLDLENEPGNFVSFVDRVRLHNSRELGQESLDEVYMAFARIGNLGVQ